MPHGHTIGGRGSSDLGCGEDSNSQQSDSKDVKHNRRRECIWLLNLFRSLGEQRNHREDLMTLRNSSLALSGPLAMEAAFRTLPAWPSTDKSPDVPLNSLIISSLIITYWLLRPITLLVLSYPFRPCC